MEKTINHKNKSNYNSILQLINHKPLIVENIFSFIKDEPYKFMHLIEKDEILKDSINKTFSIVKQKNEFSEDLNTNIQLIIILIHFRQELRNIRNINITNIINITSFENDEIKNNIDPSFFLYESKILTERAKQSISFNTSLVKPSISSLIDIIFNETIKNERIELVLLPSKDNKYKDGIYLNSYLNNENINCLNKEIERLYCIIDDNEYYLEKNLIIKKDIILNNVCFYYCKENKDINIYNAIEKYLNLLNKKNIKQITFCSNFFLLDKKLINGKKSFEYFEKIPIMEIVNDALINNKKLKFPFPFQINFDFIQDNFVGNKNKLYLGLFKLCECQKINLKGFFIIDSRNYNQNFLEKLENEKRKILIIKYNGISALVDKNFENFVKKCLKLYTNKIIFYITKENNKSQNKVKNINNINNNIKFDIEVSFDNDYDDYDYDYLLYSEIPLQISLNEIFLDSHYIEVTDSNQNLILKERLRFRYYMNFYITSYLFLLNKCNDLCFNVYCNSNNLYKIFFIKKKNNYDVFLIKKEQDTNRIKCKHYNDDVNLYEFIQYCSENFNIKINKIITKVFPFEWSDLNKKIVVNKNKSANKMGLAHKLNQKQILEYELEDNEFSDEDDDEYEEDCDYNDEN
jgi:hypothetical protein